MEAIVAEITNELMFETLKKMHQRFDKLDLAVGEVKSEITAIRGYTYGIQGDITNIYAKLARHDIQLDRIENRLELRELAEAKAKFEHAPPSDSR
jgi:predicted  nucleic acid-binding Zn-ribbon protein